MRYFSRGSLVRNEGTRETKDDFSARMKKEKPKKPRFRIIKGGKASETGIVPIRSGSEKHKLVKYPKPIASETDNGISGLNIATSNIYENRCAILQVFISTVMVADKTKDKAGSTIEDSEAPKSPDDFTQEDLYEQNSSIDCTALCREKQELRYYQPYEFNKIFSKCSNTISENCSSGIKLRSVSKTGVECDDRPEAKQYHLVAANAKIEAMRRAYGPMRPEDASVEFKAKSDAIEDARRALRDANAACAHQVKQVDKYERMLKQAQSFKNRTALKPPTGKSYFETQGENTEDGNNPNPAGSTEADENQVLTATIEEFGESKGGAPVPSPKFKLGSSHRSMFAKKPKKSSIKA